jgi:hypothetical protein
MAFLDVAIAPNGDRSAAIIERKALAAPERTMKI